MTKRRCVLAEQMAAFLTAKAEEIEGLEFGRVSFDVHHGRLVRARIEASHEFGDAAGERLTA